MTDLTQYGFDPSYAAPENSTPARVTAVHRGLLQAVCPHGEVNAELKAGVYYTSGGNETLFPAVGDFVLLQHNPNGNSLVMETLPRKSKFSRNDFSGHGAGYAKTVLEQVVAANFDIVFIVAALNQDFNPKRIQRYLVQALQSGGTPMVVLTKADLAPDCSPQVEQVQALAPGVQVQAVSAHTGAGIPALLACLAPGQTAVLLGSSGAGKSSLVNALAGEELMRVNTIREDDAKGRHTTTHRQLLLLAGGGMLIDTPGMRELGIWDATQGLDEAFADVEALLGRCRYSDCGHDTEPGCAVKQAIEDGTLSPQRWGHYLQLQREAQFVEDKAAYTREKRTHFKGVNTQVRRQKKGKPVY